MNSGQPDFCCLCGGLELAYDVPRSSDERAFLASATHVRGIVTKGAQSESFAAADRESGRARRDAEEHDKVSATRTEQAVGAKCPVHKADHCRVLTKTIFQCSRTSGEWGGAAPLARGNKWLSRWLRLAQARASRICWTRCSTLFRRSWCSLSSSSSGGSSPASWRESRTLSCTGFTSTASWSAALSGRP